MDPVTAFGLAAGILQVLDVGFKAISTCREIYKDGALAEHRETKAVTEKLVDTTNHLGTSLSGIAASGTASKLGQDVIEVAKDCSKIGREVCYFEFFAIKLVSLFPPQPSIM